MDTLAKRLSGAMQKSGFNQPGLARAATKPGQPVSQQVVQHLLSGRNTSSKHLPAIAEALNVSLDWLMRGGEPLAAAPGKFAGSGGEAGFAVTRGAGPNDRIPVLGLAECGPDGWSLWNGDVIDTVARPFNLMGAPRAYAVYIVGHSMEPRYFEGELAHIHPGKPVAVGDFVLVQMRPEQEGETPKAVVKRLVKRTGSRIVLEQYNPAKKFEIKPADIVSMHKVVGSGDP